MNHRIFGLDFIRAIAVVFVVASHTVPILQPLGVIGVEIFFVLSGFLIGGILFDIFNTKKTISLKDLKIFWLRRWGRTLPNYLFFLLVYWMLMPPASTDPTLLLKWLIKYLTFTQNLLWTIPPFYTVSWSLTIEEIFYLMLPLIMLLMVVVKLPRKFCFPATCLVLILIGITARWMYSAPPQLWDDTTRKISLGRMDALALGCMIAYSKRVLPDFYAHLRNNLWLAFSLTSAMVFLSVGLFIDYRNFSPVGGVKLYFFVLPLIFALLIPYFESIRTSCSSIATIITFISVTSYSIYLSHPLVIEFYKNVFSNCTGIELMFLEKILTWLSIIIVSYMTYRIVERPFMQMRPKQ